LNLGARCFDWRDWQETAPNLTDAAEKCLVNGKYCTSVDRLQVGSSLGHVHVQNATHAQPVLCDPTFGLLHSRLAN
jgi:hypothetical protein